MKTTSKSSKAIFSGVKSINPMGRSFSSRVRRNTAMTAWFNVGIYMKRAMERSVNEDDCLYQKDELSTY